MFDALIVKIWETTYFSVIFFQADVFGVGTEDHVPLSHPNL